MKSFKSFVEDSVKPFYACVGNFNPTDEGCAYLFEKTAAFAKNATYRIYVTTNETLLSADDNLKYLRKMHPRYARHIVCENDIQNILQMACTIYNEGYNKLVITSYSTESGGLKDLLFKHNGVHCNHGFFNFINGIDVKGIALPKRSDTLREALDNENLNLFYSRSNLTWADSLNLYNLLRNKMGLKACTYFRTHLQLTTNDIREMYIANKIYNIGENVLYKKDGKVYKIIERYTNFLKIEKDGQTKKCFLTDLCEDYYKGLSASTSDKRRAAFNKHAKLDDDDPRAYELVPGDARAKTKLSKWTKIYHDMFGDEALDENVDAALEKKSEKSGISIKILKKVFDRGMAAWRTGHRPGATQHQWAYARVNSFIVGGPTRKGPDSDLWNDHKEET